MTVAVKRLVKSATIGKKTLKADLEANFRYVAVAVRGIPIAVRWSFLLFIFTLPYEYADVGFVTQDLSKTRIAGLLFFAVYFFYYGCSRKRSLPRPPHATWWFLTYMVIFAVSALLDPGPGDQRSLSDSGVVTFAQLLVFFWITADLLQDEKMARGVLLTYAIATSLLALAMLAGFSREIDEGRLETMGDNPNASGQHMALSALIFIGLTLNGTFKRWRTGKVLVPLLMILLLAGIAATGSRAAAGAFILGCSVFLLPHWRSRRILVSVILATLGIAAAVYMVARNPDFVGRWQESYYEGDTAGRDIIYGAAIDMISERPILGWHPVSGFYELGLRVGLWTGRDTHNLFLDLLLELGIIGAIPFIIGLCLCVRAAWRARAGVLGMLPLALIIANLTASLAHTNLTWKPQWFVFAVAIAASSSKVAEPVRRSLAAFRRRSLNPSKAPS